MTDNRRVIVVGWDGATWEYVDPMLEAGELPHLAGLLQRGSRATLRSTIPPFTNVAWPSLITGRLPDKTGIFDGARTKPNSYESVPTNLVRFRGTLIWDWINQFGYRAGILNVPMTYPASPLDGFLVSGFDSLRDAPDVAYPRNLLEHWSQQGHPYRVLQDEVDLMAHQNPHHPRGDVETFVSKWIGLTKAQANHTAWIWQQQSVDLMFVVFSGTDSVNHRTRDFDQIRRVYQAADDALGTILDQVDENTLVCLISDHGSTPAYRYIALYRLLHDAGWLRFRPQIADRFWRKLPAPIGSNMVRVWQRLPAAVKRVLSWPLLQFDARLAAAYENVDWRHTTVYARSGMGPLYVNLQGRQPAGCVPADQYDALRDEVIRHLEEMQDDEGRPLFERVSRGEEIYPRARPEDAPPDLVLQPARWTDHVITGYPSDPLVRPIPDEREYGTHTPDGILALAGPGVRAGAELGPAQIVDVFPTLLAAWQVPIPEETDGNVLQSAFTTPREPVYRSSEESTGLAPEIAESDSEEVLDRLRALGYLD